MSIGDVLMGTRSSSARIAALSYASEGVPVFPCESHGKRPLTKAGFYDASDDVARVESWWKRWPNANIGVPTGDRSGIDVVDVDVSFEGSGFDVFQRAKDAGLIEDEFARVRTPSGGLHVYFPAVAARPQRCWQAARPHIDFRGTGGYVLVPPSIVATDHGSFGYRLISISAGGAKPIDAAALLSFVDPRSPRLHPDPAEKHTVDAQRLAQWVGRLQEGERNAGLFWAACRLVESGFSPAAVEESLGAAAARIGLSGCEIASTIRSASRQGTAASSHPNTWGRTDASSRNTNEPPCLS